MPQDYTPFRFQGSWHDATTDLAWVVTRWYAPSLGRFTSEDLLLGEPRQPDSRHLYAYAAGGPVGAWDPDGRRPMAWWLFKSWKEDLPGVEEYIGTALEALCLAPKPWVVAACLALDVVSGAIASGQKIKVQQRIWYRVFKKEIDGLAVKAQWNQGRETTTFNRFNNRVVTTRFEPQPRVRFEYHFSSSERGRGYWNSCAKGWNTWWFMWSVYEHGACWTLWTGLSGGQLATSYRSDGYENGYDLMTYHRHGQSRLWPQYER